MAGLGGIMSMFSGLLPMLGGGEGSAEGGGEAGGGGLGGLLGGGGGGGIGSLLSLPLSLLSLPLSLLGMGGSSGAEEGAAALAGGEGAEGMAEADAAISGGGLADLAEASGEEIPGAELEGQPGVISVDPALGGVPTDAAMMAPGGGPAAACAHEAGAPMAGAPMAGDPMLAGGGAMMATAAAPATLGAVPATAVPGGGPLDQSALMNQVLQSLQALLAQLQQTGMVPATPTPGLDPTIVPAAAPVVDPNALAAPPIAPVIAA